MRVDNQNLNGAAGLQPGRPPETNPADGLGSQSSSHRTGAVGSDHADISSLAENVSQALATQSVNRAQHIQELARQYSAGTYRPDARSISSAIVADAIGGKDGAQ